MKTLDSVTARDLMQSRVVTLPSNAPVAEAIETLEAESIGGAPVVDASGNLVGVLSARDVVRTEHLNEGRIATERGTYDLVEQEDEIRGRSFWEVDEPFSKEDYSSELLGRETVAQWMNPEIISVGPDATLGEIARLMFEQSVHRLLVVEESRLRGIISTFDVVGHLAKTL